MAEKGQLDINECSIHRKPSQLTLQGTLAVEVSQKTRMLSFPPYSKALEKGTIADHSCARDPVGHLIFSQSCRNISFFKAMQFFMLSCLISGGLWPNHKWIVFMMSNQHILTSSMFLVSGILTHLRYRPFMLDVPSSTIVGNGMSSPTDQSFEATSFRRATRRPNLRLFRVYCELRFGVYLPILIAAFAWTCLATACHPSYTPTFKQMLATLSFTSSWWSLYPLPDTSQPQELTMTCLPASLLASAFLTIWLLYPVIVRALWWGEELFTRRLVSRLTYIGSTLVFFGLIWPYMSFLTLRLMPLPEMYGDKGPIYDVTTEFGSALHWLNPVFVVPRFVAGVVVAELLHYTGWVQSGGKQPDQAPDAIMQQCGFFQRWILPYLSDLCMLTVFLLYTLDPSHDDYWSMRMFGPVARVLSLSSELTHQTWAIAAPWVVFPLSALTSVLFCHPFAHRSLTWKILVQDPILAVLPGRSAIIISFFAPLCIKSLSESMQKEIHSGAGFFFVCFLIFTSAIPFYYYIYQPFHLWRCLRLAGQTNSISVSSVLEAGDGFLPLASSPSTSVSSSNPNASQQPSDNGLMSPNSPLSDSKTSELMRAGTISPVKAHLSCQPAALGASSYLRVLTSPHYDPFYPGKDSQELKVYTHISRICPPTLRFLPTAHLSLWHWAVKLFVTTQFVE